MPVRGLLLLLQDLRLLLQLLLQELELLQLSRPRSGAQGLLQEERSRQRDNQKQRREAFRDNAARETTATLLRETETANWSETLL